MFIGALLGMLFIALLAHVQCRDLKRRAERARAAHHRLHRWVRGNLLIIRCQCVSSPEALSIVNSLERALPVLAEVDGDDLRDDLALLRQTRDVEVLRLDSERRAKAQTTSR